MSLSCTFPAVIILIKDIIIINTNFVVLGTISWPDSGWIVHFYDMLSMPLTANPFLYDLCGLSLSPTSMIYI